MYYQITNRCNMLCDHCCTNSTAKGEDMSIQTFKNALKHDWSECVALGGGEPTIHPQFWEFIGIALGHFDHVWLATNGKKTDIALTLANLARKGVLGVALSQDEFHDRINPKVVDAFTKEHRSSHNDFIYGRSDNDQREIRNTTAENDPYKTGRCDWGRDGCVCEDLVVLPSGDIQPCGCYEAKDYIIGNVNDPNWSLPENWEYGLCYKDQPAISRRLLRVV